jgi:hypothetical protein
MVAITLVQRIGRIVEASPEFVDHLLVWLARGSSKDTLIDGEAGYGPRIGHEKSKCSVMPVIELPKVKASLVLFLAELFPESQTPEGRSSAQPACLPCGIGSAFSSSLQHDDVSAKIAFVQQTEKCPLQDPLRTSADLQ